MKEFPILFKGELVRAILEGRKTVTRRPVKVQPDNGWAFDGSYGRVTSKHPKQGRYGAFMRRGVGTDFPEFDIVPCPFGQPGDRLWVRETTEEEVLGSGSMARYAADDSVSSLAWWGSRRSCPSIHMPRFACRILLEVTDVRVERLHDIAEAQAEAEGAQPWCFDWMTKSERDLMDWPLKEKGHPFRNGFAMLWESTGAKWADNPWVWVVSFKRVEQAAASGV